MLRKGYIAPKKNAPEFYYDERKGLYRKRIKNKYTGAWVDVYGEIKKETGGGNVARCREQFAIEVETKDTPYVYQHTASWFLINTKGLSWSRKEDCQSYLPCDRLTSDARLILRKQWLLARERRNLRIR